MTCIGRELECHLHSSELLFLLFCTTTLYAVVYNIGDRFNTLLQFPLHRRSRFPAARACSSVIGGRVQLPQDLVQEALLRCLATLQVDQ